PRTDGWAPDEAGEAASARLVTVAGEAAAAGRLAGVLAQEILVRAAGEHFAFGAELIRILDTHAQSRGVEEPLKQAQKDRVRRARAEAPNPARRQRRVDRNEPVLADVKRDDVAVVITLEGGGGEDPVGKED